MQDDSWGECHANGFQAVVGKALPTIGSRRFPGARCSRLGIIPDAHIRPVPAANRVLTASVKHAATTSDPASPISGRPADPGRTGDTFPGFSRWWFSDPVGSRRRDSRDRTPAGRWWTLLSAAPAVAGLFAARGRRASFFRFAPPGMQLNDPQGGIGAALYRPLRIPSPDQMPTDLDREKFVTRGLFPGTYLVPATNTSFRWYGFVRLDGIYDFNPIASTDSFVTSSIPVPQGRGQNVALTPRYSRLGLDTWTPTSLWDWNVHTRIELDFFNGNNSGVFGSYPPRLRYAYADFGPFRLGQSASTFMDYDVFPNVLDYQGPDGMVLMRQVVARVTIPVCDQVHVAFAAEQPYSDIQWFQDDGFTLNPGTGIITTAGAPRNVQDMPDFISNVRYDSDFGHLQVAGILRKLTFQPSVGSDKNVPGWRQLHGRYPPGPC